MRPGKRARQCRRSMLWPCSVGLVVCSFRASLDLLSSFRREQSATAFASPGRCRPGVARTGDVECTLARILRPEDGRGLSSQLYAADSAQGEMSFEDRKMALKECLRREYTSFFRPFESDFYTNDVIFRDPLNELKGKDRYRANVEMLSGGSFVGNILFKDGYINLHAVEDVPGEERQLRTRWTLGFTFKLLPWQPQALFSGVSEYTIDENAKVLTQRDYWDTINLGGDGTYSPEALGAGVADLVAQFIPAALQSIIPQEFRAAEEPGAATAGKWTLLRRATAYRIYRSDAGSTVFAYLVPDARESFDDLKSLLRGHGLQSGTALHLNPSTGSVDVLADDSVAAALKTSRNDGTMVVGVELLPPHPWE